MNDEALKVWLGSRFRALANYDKMPPERQAKLDALIAESDGYIADDNILYANGVLGELWVECSLNRLMSKAPPPTPEDIAANAAWLAPLAQAVQDAGVMPVTRREGFPSPCNDGKKPSDCSRCR